MSKHVKWIHVYAVVRVPAVLVVYDDEGFEHQVNVVSVWPKMEDASSEVDRLNELNGSKGERYAWQSTHLFPSGRGTAASP
jgi:hypothetical protein